MRTKSAKKVFAPLNTWYENLSHLQKMQYDILVEAMLCRLQNLLNPVLKGQLGLPNSSQLFEYSQDFVQRTILLLDVLRKRGDNSLEHKNAGYPLVLKFPYEVLIDGHNLPNPVNYSLLKIIPSPDVPTNFDLRPIIIIDPRGGHGSGIGGFKQNSEVGEALRAGHPTYFISFSHEPVPGQTLLDIGKAEARFIEYVRERHLLAGKPVIIGNCQAGWALMGLAAARPDLPGLVIVNGAPISYWSGINGRNPMRYAGGLLGGAWLTRFASDLGNGRFDGTYLVSNFEALNPANTYWGKIYNLFSNIDTEEERFLDFERWWGNPTLLNREEIETIVDDLFIGNSLANKSKFNSRLDLRRIEAPVVVFCSYGDNITPPQQALNWISDTYPTDLALRSAGRTIVYLTHADIGHLGIFVSASVAQREHRQLIGALETIDILPPGLFELVIKEKEGTNPPEYEVLFEARKIDDIKAVDFDGRDEEREFEVVDRISSVNNLFYEWLVRPTLQLLINEPLAEFLRQMHPFNLQQTIFSSMNPALCWLPVAAQKVRQNRLPVAKDNPLLAWQESYSNVIESSLNNYRDARDALYELWFHTIYGGLSAANVGHGSQEFAEISNNWDQELVNKLHEELPRGNCIKGIIRILLMLGQQSGVISKERIEQIAHKSREILEPFGFELLSLHDAVHLQSLLVFAYPEESIETLPLLIPEKQRFKVLEAVAHILPEVCNANHSAHKLWLQINKVLAQI